MSSLAGLFLTFSLPVYHNTKYRLDSMAFSKTTLYTEHLFQSPYSRQATLKKHSRTSITRVAENPRTNTPTLRNTRFAEADLRGTSTGREVAHRLAYPPRGHGVTAVPRPATSH